MSINGTILKLVAGDYEATVAASGATLVSLTHAGRDLILPFDPNRELGPAFLGRTLAPWPNRISDARYTFDGVQHHVPCNEPTTGAALHGLASYVAWDVAESTADIAEFVLDLPAAPGYPFDVILRVRYLLDADLGLVVHVGAANAGPTDAPVGLSVHPYLTCGAPVDECTLLLPAGEVLLVDGAMRPTDLHRVELAGFDFRTPTSLAGRRVDHAFTSLPDAGQGIGGGPGWSVVLAHPERGGVVLASDAPWVQAFTGDHPELKRGGVAVEPMTCPPDGFNRDPEGVRLRPGDVTLLRYSISSL